MIRLEEFITRTCQRETVSLANPRLKPTHEIKLPYGALIHHLSDSQADIGIRGSHPLLRQNDGSARIAFISDGYGNYGRFQKIATNTSKLIRAYRQTQKGIDYFGSPERALSRERELCVFDYSLLSRMYKYTQSITRLYDEWRNITTAIINKVNDPSIVRYHMIQIKMPDSFPAEGRFKSADDGFGSQHFSEFFQPGHFWLYELRRFMLGKSEVLNIKHPDKVFFILSEATHSVVIQASQLISRGETQITKIYDMFEALQATRPGADTEALENEDTAGDVSIDEEELIPGVPNTMTRKLVELNSAGKVTNRQAQAMINIVQRIDEQTDPFGSGKTVGEASKVTSEMTRVNEELIHAINPKTVPPHALRSSTNSLYRDYVRNKVYQADLLNVVKAFSAAGVLVQDIKVEEKVDALNEGIVITLKLLPINGRASTAKIELFNLNEDGTFKADGIMYAMDSQKVDVPIRKTHAHRAALTSYFGKLFIQRSQLVANNYSLWVVRNITKAGLLSEDTRILNIRFGESTPPKSKMPRAYTAIMKEISEFDDARGRTFNFEYQNRKKFFGDKAVAMVEAKGDTIVGKKGNDVFGLDLDSNLIQYSAGQRTNLGPFMVNLSSEWTTPPQEFTEIANLKGKRVPVGLVMAYHLSFSKLLRKLNVAYRTEPANVRSTGTADEFSLTFQDQRVHFKFKDKQSELILAGFSVVEDILKGFNLADLNKRDIYGPLLKSVGCQKFHMNEIDLIEELFVDPITKEVLIDMKEPTNILDLYVRCSELVVTDEHPDETDPEFMRERRLERIPGFLYSAMVKATREQRNKPNPSLHPIYIGPRDVWTAVTSDSTTQLVKELNPIHTLKQLEAVSLSGEGGRAAETLVKSSRVFHPKDVGRFSADTPDSGKVGIRTFAPPNTRIKNLRGMHGDFDFERDGATSVLSTTGLILPAMHHDDAKRQNLGSVQMSAFVPAVGYEVMPCRTGYDSVVASRLGPLYVVRVEKPGEVVAVKEKFLKVVYDDGTKEGWEIGTIHGKAEGKAIPHIFDTDMKKGDKFTPGDILAWNTGFFERDFFAPRNVVMKTGAMFRTVLMENNDTLEDGSRIGPRVQTKLSTWTSKEKGILVNFGQVVENLVQVGQDVAEDDNLCRIFEAGTEGLANTNAALDALNKLVGSNPTAGKQGKVTRVEVVYNGRIEDMHPSLQAIAEADNKRRATYAKETGRNVAKTGQISRPSFVSGEKVIQDTMVISIFIDSLLPHGVGDKHSMANQLKSVPGGTLDGINQTLDGKEIDVIFGYRSVNDRIVGSPIKQGTVNTTMIAVTDLYFDILLNGPKK